MRALRGVLWWIDICRDAVCTDSKVGGSVLDELHLGGGLNGAVRLVGDPKSIG